MHPVQRQSYISSTINIKHRVPLNTDFIVTVEATIDFWHKKVQKIKFLISFPHETRKKHPKIAEISSTALVAQNNKSTRLISVFFVGMYFNLWICDFERKANFFPFTFFPFWFIHVSLVEKFALQVQRISFHKEILIKSCCFYF